MIERNSFILICFLFLLSCPSFSNAVQKEVIFLPRGARVTDYVKLRLLPEGKDRSKGVFIIPAQADPASLVIDPPREPRLKIEDIRWRNIKANEDAKTQEFRKRAKALKYEKSRLEAYRQALDAQIQFWQQQIKAKVKSPTEASTFASLIGKNVKAAFQEKLNLVPELFEIERKIKELDEEFKIWDGRHTSKWEVTILFSGSPAGDASLTYSYALTDCGWLPLYRLDAHPEKGEIRFIIEAEIWQNSTENWHDVDVSLSNINFTSSLAPPEILPNIIKSWQGIKFKGKGTTSRTKATSLPHAAVASEGSAPAADTDMASLVTWKAGKKTIIAGSHQIIRIREEIWPADFNYIARPSKSTQVFINASFHLPDLLEIPRGNTMFFLEDTMIGKADFIFKGQNGSVFFGPDPSVTATALTVKQDTNNNYPDDKKIYLRQLRVLMENHHTFPLKMRVEEPTPSSSDENIKISLDYSPAPSEQKSATLIWNFDLAAGEKKELMIGVKVETPANLEIDSQWQ